MKFSYFLRFYDFCHLNFETGVQSTAGCRQTGSVGFLKAPEAQGSGWVHPMVYGAVGSVWGQLWVSCGKGGRGHWLILALGIQSWGRREGKALVRQHHQVQCRTAGYSLELCFSSTIFIHTSLLGGIWQCHSKTSLLLALKRKNMVKSNVEVIHENLIKILLMQAFGFGLYLKRGFSLYFCSAVYSFTS